ncbi:hypothetical protein GCM10017688_56620 [Streptomyces ramulosus]
MGTPEGMVVTEGCSYFETVRPAAAAWGPFHRRPGEVPAVSARTADLDQPWGVSGGSAVIPGYEGGP